MFADTRENVFVVGSARSGTSLVGSILTTSSKYAKYPAETKLLAECGTKYGKLSNPHSRQAFYKDWVRSRQFVRSGLSEEVVMPMLEASAEYIQFLSRYMGMVTVSQGRDRWIDTTPDNGNCLTDIAVTFPNAKVIHVIRDGRAVSASKAKLGWSGVRTDNYDKALCYSSLLWAKAIGSIRKQAGVLGNRYCEVKYEELVERPLEAIDFLANFLGVDDISKEVISGEYAKTNKDERSPLHTPNSIYGDMTSGISKTAAYRWKKILSPQQVCNIETSIGDTLAELGYPLTCTDNTKLFYPALVVSRKLFLNLKATLKKTTFLGRYATSPLEIGFD